MSIRSSLRRWSAYRRTYNELARLSNRELNDLGISRCEIPHIARMHSNSVIN